MMIVCVAFAIMFIGLSFVYLRGKGDKLIAGYNTASEKERKQWNIKRLRRLMATMMTITAGYCLALPLVGIDKNRILLLTAALVGITLVFLIMANTWATKQ